MKRIELKELIREVVLTEFQSEKEIESKINEFGEVNHIFYLPRPAFSIEAAVLLI